MNSLAPSWSAVASSALLLVGLGLATPTSHAEELRELVRARTYVMLRDVRQEIERNYFDPTFKGVDLGAKADLAKARIAKASSIGEAFAAIAQFVLELDDSHTFFVPPAQTVRVDYGWKMAMIEDGCYVVRVKPGSDAARQNVAPGDRVAAVNGFRPSRDNLWRLEYMFDVLRPQPGLHVELVPPAGNVRELDLAARVEHRKAIVDLTGAEGGDIAHEIQESEKALDERQPTTAELGSDVLIVRLPSFSVPESSVQRILRLAHGHATLILDLRGNRGGSADNLQVLLGGLAPADVTIGTYRERQQSRPLVAKGSGRNAFAGRVFVLVDAESASASELLARVVQLTNRGTIIGDKTAGAVMLSRYRPLIAGSGDNVIAYGARVTVADVVMTDGGGLEKNGVEPDFKVVPTAEDLAAGRDPALARAVTFAGRPMDGTAAGALLRRN